MLFFESFSGKGISRSSQSRRSQSNKNVSYGVLEPRQLLAGVVLNEFLASNSSGLVDDNGSTSDWVELYNDGPAVDLAGYFLTDDPGNPTKFVFSSQPLAANGYLVVFAGDDTNLTGGDDLYTGFGLSSSGEYLGLYDSSGTLVSEFSAGGTNYPAQISDVSYGFLNNGLFNQPSYFSTPTPGAANTNPVAGVVDRVSASLTPGFYDTTQTVSLSTPTSGASIFYTTDGSTPSATNGISYSGPISITGTTTLRAIGVKSGSLSVPDRTWSYLFVDDIINQSNDGAAPAGFPAVGSLDQELDYGIDPQVIGIEGAQAIKDALLAIPSWSITTDIDNLFDPATGIYSNAQQDGDAWERAASVEQLNPDGTEGFQVNAGLRIRGASSRADSNPKHSFKLFFRGEYGDSSLDYDVFKDTPGTATSFERIDIRTAQNYSWSKDGDTDNVFVTDVFNRQNQQALGQPSTNSSWIHLYLNGQYWGLYQTQERVDADFAESYFGGDADDYDVIKADAAGYVNVAADGNTDAYYALHAQALARAADGQTPAFVNTAAYMEAQGLNPDGSDNPAFETLLDVDSVIAFMIVTLQSGNIDGPLGPGGRVNNYYTLRDRTGDEGFKFFVHDTEHTYTDLREDPLTRDRNGAATSSNYQQARYFNPQWLHQQLMANEEYRIRFADKVQESFFNDGPNSVSNQLARLDAQVAAIDQAIIAESARWGDAQTNSPLLRDPHWLNAINELRELIAPRHDVVVEQFRNTSLLLLNGDDSTSASLFPDVDAPIYDVDGSLQSGGLVTAGASIGLSATEGTIYFTTDGTDPRLPGGAVSPSATAFNSSLSETTVFEFGSTWKYHDLGADLGSAWQGTSYNDATWSSAATQLGYGGNGEANTVSFGNDSNNKHITTYFRKTFNLAAGNYLEATLNVKRDDGVVVYLNGIEIGRNNIDIDCPVGCPVSFNTEAESAIGGSGETTPVQFSFDPALLLVGNNTLAVEIHQVSNRSSDLTFDAELEVTTQTSQTPNLTLNTSTNIQARTLSGGQWSALHDSTFVIPASQSELRISELHFNPAVPTAAEIAAGYNDNDDFEFIEIYNPSTTGTINLSGVQLSDGVTFVFSDTDLLPGQRAVVVEDVDAFMQRYGDSDTVLGQWSGSLSNSGEEVALLDSSFSEIMSVNYEDNDPWHDAASGNGFSLVLEDPVNTPVDALGKYYSWRSSTLLGGTPGEASIDRAGVVVNEVLAHTDAPQSDSIELFNTTSASINVGGWYLSDQGNDLFKFQIPAGTAIAAGGYLVFDESDFNVTATGFALNGSQGDQVYLSQGVAGVFVALQDAVEFDATFNGESLGRLPNGTGRLTRLANNSFGSANGIAEVGPLVISEVNYHPDTPTATALSIDPTITDNDLEYIEIVNPTSATVDLTNWRIRGEADFDFAPGTSLPAGEAIVVASFDPAVDTAKFLAFRVHYGTGLGVTIVGGLSASLSNSTGRISLQQPDTLEVLGAIPNVVVDEVVYDDIAPWPDADGSGLSLQRDDLETNGNFFTSWIVATPTPGAFDAPFLLGDVNQDGFVDFLDISPFISVLSGSPYLAEADINEDGFVTFLDINPFITLLSS